MLNMQKFGRRIADLRLQSGLTQRQIATAVGVSIQAVSKWERGLSCPDMMLLDEIAVALGVGIVDLFEDQASHVSSKKHEII